MLVLRPKPRSTMKKKDHTPEQIITKPRKVEALTAPRQTVAEAARHIDLSEHTYYRWTRQYGGMRRDQLMRPKALDKHNARLKKLVAALSLDRDILPEDLP